MRALARSVRSARNRPTGRRSRVPGSTSTQARRVATQGNARPGVPVGGPIRSRKRAPSRSGVDAPDVERYARAVQRLTVALAQIAPQLGQLDANLARHHELIEEARGRGAGPRRLPGARADRLPAPGPRRGGRDAARRPAPGGARGGDRRTSPPSSRSSRSRPTTACSSRRPCSRTARSGTSTGSCSCPRTGCSTSGGSSPRAISCGRRRRGSGSASGSAVCEDFWHLTVPQLLALDGAQILINVSSSPGRDLAATNEVGLGTATSWRTLMRTYAQLTTSFVVFCNRVGVDESISFWGGSEVIAPNGAGALQRAAVRRRACSSSRSPLARRPPRAARPAAAARRAARAPGPRAVADRRRAGGPRARHDRRRRRRAGPRRGARASRSASRSASGRGLEAG